jgi:hypothetical protein
MGKFDVRRSSANNQFYYRFSASNGEPVQSGEGYTTKENCLKGIASVKANCQDARFKRTQTAGTSPYGFNQEAANGEIIGRGEKYTGSTGRENGIAVVIREAPSAPINDLT